MKSIWKKANTVATRIYVRGRILQQECAQKLAHRDGASLSVETILVIILVIVVMAGLIFPKVWKALEGSLDNAGSKIDSLWDYKG